MEGALLPPHKLSVTRWQDPTRSLNWPSRPTEEESCLFTQYLISRVSLLTIKRQQLLCESPMYSPPGDLQRVGTCLLPAHPIYDFLP